MKRIDPQKTGDGDAALETDLRDKSHLSTSELGWVTHAEAQRLLGCSRASLYRWRNAYGLRSARLGRKLYFELSSLMEVLEKHAGGKP